MSSELLRPRLSQGGFATYLAASLVCQDVTELPIGREHHRAFAAAFGKIEEKLEQIFRLEFAIVPDGMHGTTPVIDGIWYSIVRSEMGKVVTPPGNIMRLTVDHAEARQLLVQLGPHMHAMPLFESMASDLKALAA